MLLRVKSTLIFCFIFLCESEEESKTLCFSAKKLPLISLKAEKQMLNNINHYSLKTNHYSLITNH